MYTFSRAILPSRTIIAINLYLFVLITFAAPAYAVTTLYVSPSGSDDNSGVANTPYRTIQAAINNASDGDIVLLEDGTYFGNGNRDIDFGGKNITIKSRNGADKTVLDCEGKRAETEHDSVKHRAFHIHHKESKSKISGISVRNGYQDSGGAMSIEAGTSVLLENCMFQKNVASLGGTIHNGGVAILANCRIEDSNGDEAGGILNYGQITLRQCIFSRNSAKWCGGVSITANSKAEMVDCIFSDNNGYDAGGIDNSGMLIMKNSQITGNKALRVGGGINNRSLMFLTDCTISGNKAGESGAGINNRSGVIRMTGCTLENNILTPVQDVATTGRGAAIYNASNITLIRCTISGNQSSAFGGGIYQGNGNSTLVSCVFSGNKIDSNLLIEAQRGQVGDGGGIYIQYGEMSLVNCTLFGNKATRKGGGIFNSGQVTLTNSLLWNDTAPDANEVGLAAEGNPTTTATYCNIQGGLSGKGNIKSDPLFADAANNDFHLKTGSPCIGAGVNVLSTLLSLQSKHRQQDDPDLSKAFTIDRESKPRPNAPAIGAYEPGRSSIPIKKPNKE